MIRLYNCKVLALDGVAEVLDRELWIDGDTILFVGPTVPDRPVFEREIDLRGDLVMPGFKNAHAHSAMSFLRSFADDLPLQKWLFEKVIPYEAKLTPDDIYALTRFAVLENLAAGITSSFEMYYHRSVGARAAVDSNYRMVFCGGIASGDDFGMCENDLFNIRRLGSPLVSYISGVHSEYLSDPDLLMCMKQFVDEYSLPFYAHNAETKREVDECIERNDMTPTALFEDYGLYEHGGGGFHCVWFTPEDMDIFARRGLYAVTCPASNAKLASGIAPITELQKKGVPLAIGTDGQASNNSLDIFREMYLVSVLQKLQKMDASACDAVSVLEMACCGSARAMGLPDCDSLAFGKKADLIVIDLHKPNMLPYHNIPKNLVYSGSNANVRMTMVNGNILYEDGVYHVGETPERIYRDALAAVERVTRS